MELCLARWKMGVWEAGGGVRYLNEEKDKIRQ